MCRGCGKGIEIGGGNEMNKEEYQRIKKKNRDQFYGTRNSSRIGKKGCFGQSAGQNATRKWMKETGRIK